ncbi:MAG: YopX family protein [Sphaerochaeta sp.]|jgi:uncharacterized phage protein (TIGR01671 family)|nr:YopX family protein [Sphaerochaeta sp.]
MPNTAQKPIKFRVWDDYSKGWLKDGSVRIGGDGQMYYFDKGTVEEYLKDLADNLIIERFTGLLDKNGKEIFEGDILESQVGHLMKDGQKRKYIVGWGGFICGFDFSQISPQSESEKYPSQIINQDMTGYLVIGNVHQHQMPNLPRRMRGLEAMTQKTRDFLRNGGYVIWFMIAVSALLYYFSFTEKLEKVIAEIGSSSSISCVSVDTIRFLDEDGKTQSSATVYACLRKF